jgi:hypothetical protein
MSILLALLYLALIILAVGLGYYVVVWALGIAGITINPRILQFLGAIVVVLILIWFVREVMAGGGLHMPTLR